MRRLTAQSILVRGHSVTAPAAALVGLWWRASEVGLRSGVSTAELRNTICAASRGDLCWAAAVASSGLVSGVLRWDEVWPDLCLIVIIKIRRKLRLCLQ